MGVTLNLKHEYVFERFSQPLSFDEAVEDDLNAFIDCKYCSFDRCSLISGYCQRNIYRGSRMYFVCYRLYRGIEGEIFNRCRWRLALAKETFHAQSSINAHVSIGTRKGTTQESEYHLVAVLNHHGATATSGHYTTDTLDATNQGEVHRCIIEPISGNDSN